MIGSSHIIIKRKFICPDLRNLFVSTLVFVFLIVAIWWIYTSNLKKTRDAERYADSALLLSSLVEYQNDHGGALPALVDDDPSSLQMITTENGSCDGRCSAGQLTLDCLNLSNDLIPNYLSAIPTDSYYFGKKPIRAYVGYYLNRGLSGQVIVGSCYPEYEDQIMVVH
ncbi:MAG TPA: hypothetical protein VJA22_01090 [Patescibacteria group bacterium]|nr:hypothetical protein [Patescibacteria group bacterium]